MNESNLPYTGNNIYFNRRKCQPALPNNINEIFKVFTEMKLMTMRREVSVC